jgi:HPt (histidine-containing phosphotransfer) domain-containing protein
MSGKQPHPAPVASSSSEIFDRAHLSHYTLQNEELEREILGLFLAQLIQVVEQIEAADTPVKWRLCIHTLKGSAASVGARRLQAIAEDLEALGFAEDRQVRGLRAQVLRGAAAEFRGAVRHIHP